jgi:hypothetical protein
LSLSLSRRKEKQEHHQKEKTQNDAEKKQGGQEKRASCYLLEGSIRLMVGIERSFVEMSPKRRRKGSALKNKSSDTSFPGEISERSNDLVSALGKHCLFCRRKLRFQKSFPISTQKKNDWPLILGGKRSRFYSLLHCQPQAQKEDQDVYKICSITSSRSRGRHQRSHQQQTNYNNHETNPQTQFFIC